MHRRWALVVVGGLLLTGCSSTPTPAEPLPPTVPAPSSTADPLPEPSSTQTLAAPEVDATDRGLFDASPDEVMAGAVLALLTFDTAVDVTPQAVAERAADWFVPEAAPTTVPEPWGSQWDSLTDAKSSTVIQDLADVTEAGAPPDSAGAVARQYAVTVRVTDIDGTQTVELVVLATLARGEGGFWLVDYLEVI